MHTVAAPSRVRDEVGFLSIPLVGWQQGRFLDAVCAETHRVSGSIVEALRVADRTATLTTEQTHADSL